MADTRLQVQAQPFTLYGAGATLGDTSITLTDFNGIDGTALTLANFGTKGFLTLEPGSSTQEEQVSFTGLTTNANGTVTLTGVSTVSFIPPYTETSGLAKSHAGATRVVISNTSGFYNSFAVKGNNETITELWTFSGNGVTPTQAVYTAPVLDGDFVTKKYVVDTFAGGSVSNAKVIVTGLAGETVAAGNLVYKKTSDGFWWKCDADTAATVDNVNLGIAQGAGTAGNSISGGVLTFGNDTTNTGLTTGITYYASNTAGAISSSAGTVEVALGTGQADGTFLFNPRFPQQLTEDQQDALAGTSGTPSATNLFVTANDMGRNTSLYNYGASVVGTDSYAITLSPALTAYAPGQEFNVLADVGNTTACTLAVNGLAAINIKTQDGSDPATGYIHANSLFKVRYDGTNMVLQSPNAVDTKPTKVVTISPADGAVGSSAGLSITDGFVAMNFADSVDDQAAFTVIVPPAVTTLSSINVLYTRLATGNLYLRFFSALIPVAGGTLTLDQTDAYTTYAATSSANTVGVISVPAGAFNAIATVSPGDVITFMPERDASNAADTFSATWQVVGIQFTFA